MSLLMVVQGVTIPAFRVFPYRRNNSSLLCTFVRSFVHATTEDEESMLPSQLVRPGTGTSYAEVRYCGLTRVVVATEGGRGGYGRG